MEKIKAHKFIVKGFVQGVGFRSFCHYHAIKFDLSGSVKNLPNGDVEIFIQGLPLCISLFFDKIKQGPPGSLVEEVVTEENITPLGRKGFSIV